MLGLATAGQAPSKNRPTPLCLDCLPAPPAQEQRKDLRQTSVTKPCALCHLATDIS